MTDKIPFETGFAAQASYLIQLYHLALGSGAILRFIAAQPASGSVSFAGQSYDAWPVHLQPPIYEQGKLINGLRLSVSNRDHRFTSAFAADQIRFSTLTRFLSFASELDSPHGTGGGSCFAPDRW